MKKVLFVSYLFPPLNCGVGRQVKITKYLPRYGWSPVVLSARKSHLRPRYDESMLKDISPETEVHRTFSLESKIFMIYLPAAFRLNYKYFQVPDQFIGWLPFAVKKGLEIIKKEKIDVIASTSMPNTCHLVAYLLKKKTGLPWVADFREAWTQNPFIEYPKTILDIENRMEGAVMENADRITVINDPIRQAFMKKYPMQPKEKFTTIPHGFDPEDFDAVKGKPHDGFLITYTGSFYGRRSPEKFLGAVKEALEENEGLRRDLKIQFIGNVKKAEKTAKIYGLNQWVTTSGLVTHEKVFSHLKNSDALLLIIGTGRDDSSISTGKIFEYLGSRTPILGVVPEGVAADIIRSSGSGVVAHPDDKEAIKEAILQLYLGGFKTKHNLEEIERYDMRKLSERFSEVLNEARRKD